jgi:hypothetical protein
LLELVHSLPGRRHDRGADQQHAGEPEETADPDEHTSCCDTSPAELDFPAGCRIAHNVSLVMVGDGSSDAFKRFEPSGSDRLGERLVVAFVLVGVSLGEVGE